MLYTLISDVWRHGVVPENWKKALIVPLVKKDDQTNIDNCEGISLLRLLGNVFPILLKDKLQNWAGVMLMEGYCGSRKGRSCNDAFPATIGYASLQAG